LESRYMTLNSLYAPFLKIIVKTPYKK